MGNSRKRLSKQASATKARRAAPKKRNAVKAKKRVKRKVNPAGVAAGGPASKLVRGVRVYPSIDAVSREAPIGEAVVFVLSEGPSPFAVVVRYGEGASEHRILEHGLSEAKAVAVAHSSNDLLEAMARPNPGKRKAARGKAPRRMRQERLPNPLERLAGEVSVDNLLPAGTDERARNEQMALVLRTVESRELVHGPSSNLAFVPWLARYLGLEGDPARVVWLLVSLYQTGHVDLWLDDDRERVIAATDRGLCPCIEGRTAVWVSRRVKS